MARSPASMWSDYKLTALKVLLSTGAVVLVAAQVLPPVGDFIAKQAYLGVAFILGLVFLLLDTLLAPAKEVAGDGDGPAVLQQTGDLNTLFPGFLQQRELRLRLASYSSETFYSVISGGLLDKIAAGEGRLRSLELQILLPDCSAPMGVPCLMETGKESAAYKRYLVQRTDRFVREFENAFHRVIAQQPQMKVSLEVRFHRLSPLFKTVIVDDSVAYFGIYPIDRTPVLLGGSEQLFIDFRGERTQLAAVRAGSIRANESTTFKALDAWFSSVWSSSASTTKKRIVSEES